METALIAAEAPRDIVTGNASEVDPLSPAGLAVADMSGAQRSMLMELVDVHLSLRSDEMAPLRTGAVAGVLPTTERGAVR